MPRFVRFVLLTVVLFPSFAYAMNDSTFGEPQVASTPHSLSLECPLEGDANHDAQCELAYRVAGAAEWTQALAPLRVDFQGYYAGARADRQYNMFAGSILHLKPGTNYELKWTFRDPDGGDAEKTFPAATRALPQRPEGGKTWHVQPGSRKGKGSEESPFGTVDEVQKVISPGDVVLLRAGNYGRARFNKSGTAEKYVVWQAADEGEVVFSSMEVLASHIWLEGLYVEGSHARPGLQAVGKPTNVVVRRNIFVGFPYSIMMNSSSSNWYVNDNLIDARSSVDSSVGGEAIDLGKSSGHVVAHNRISRSVDGIVYPKSNCDIFGNELVDLIKDGFKGDYGYANNRYWGNRLTNVGGNAVTFQPMYCGPWYFVRNQFCNAKQLFKFRVQDRFVWVNNTVIGPSPFGDRMHYFLSAFSRNNLFISTGKADEDSSFWVALDCRQRSYCLPNNYRPTWMTGLDNDGFDWGDIPMPFVWDNGGTKYESLEEFAAAIGIEKKGRRLLKDQTFESTQWQTEDGAFVPQVLKLREGGPAIDAGEPLPNLLGEHQGAAPDLGAHEFGAEPIYGPLDPNRAASSVVGETVIDP